MVQLLNAGRIVQILNLHEFFTQGNPFFSQGRLLGLFVHNIMFVFMEMGHDLVNINIELG